MRSCNLIRLETDRKKGAIAITSSERASAVESERTLLVRMSPFCGEGAYMTDDTDRTDMNPIADENGFFY